MSQQSMIDSVAKDLTDLLQITTDLTRILEEENTALHAGKAKTVESMMARKGELCTRYGEAMTKAKIKEEMISKADKSLRKALRSATQKFKDELTRNQQLLKHQVTLREKLMQTIGNEVERQRNPVRTYAHPAQQKTNQGAPAAFALNQTV